MLKVLFIGDVVGRLGREAVKEILPKLKKELEPDLVIANAENIAHGAGVSKGTLPELFGAGVDYCTTGDHAFDKEKQIDECYKEGMNILRPANYPPDVPGAGYALINFKKGKEDYEILLINLVGRVFMNANFDCPFRKLDEILNQTDLIKKKNLAIIIDLHAEATAEKIIFRHYADGRVSAILGTHTHVATADEEVTEKGTAYISDTGMVGSTDGCIGVNKEEPLKSILTQIKYKHVIPEKGKATFNAVLITIDPKTGKAKDIKRIKKNININ
jgi:hypothetical protein